MSLKKFFLPLSVIALLIAEAAHSESVSTIDLRTMQPEQGLTRIFGFGGQGRFGVPVAGGYDMDGDGHQDYAFSLMAVPGLDFGSEGELVATNGAGAANIIFGDGTLGTQSNIEGGSFQSLTIYGGKDFDTAGSEIWMGDVTGDGLGDLIIARQNFTRRRDGNRIGAGAITIIPGSPALREFATELSEFDFLDRLTNSAIKDLPNHLRAMTIVGENAYDRLGIWVRTGDITGDGVDDIVVGADQAQARFGETQSGKVYVIRGGRHLAKGGLVDLGNVLHRRLNGHVLEILPPEDAEDFHLGATVNIADLDGNGYSEVLMGATLLRAGAALGPTNDTWFGVSADSSGGAEYGRMFIAWDDLFQGRWRRGAKIDLGANSESVTDITGASTDLFTTRFFGEELLGGLDYNNDGSNDLFVGDISGDTNEYIGAGLGFVFFSAETLKGVKGTLGSLPENIDYTVILGNENGTISGDTAMHGNFDSDEFADLAISSPHASPLGRTHAGILHVLWGQADWPDVIDLQLSAESNTNSSFKITNIVGANGAGFYTRGTTSFTDAGDTLAYSGAAGDINNDGLDDIITNEMVGNTPADGDNDTFYDSGNLIIISGEALANNKPN